MAELVKIEKGLSSPVTTLTLLLHLAVSAAPYLGLTQGDHGCDRDVKETGDAFFFCKHACPGCFSLA